MRGFGDFDLEALAAGELEGDFGFGEEGVEDLVGGAEAHDADLIAEVGDVFFDVRDYLVVD